MTIPTQPGVSGVEIRPLEDRPGVVELRFASAALGRTSTSLVWLPADGTPPPWPVTYYLHGTVGTTFPAPLERRADRRLARGLPVHPMLARSRRRAVTPDTMGFAESRDRHPFLVVAPDAGERAWCGVCNWIDGRGGRAAVAAETHLHDELMPTVERLFDTRSDPGGRGVIGHSMGGGGAMIQAFRHPDRFTIAGSSSGTLTIMDDWMSRVGARWLVYNRTQGRPPIPFDPIDYRNHNLVDLAPNVRGIDIELIVVIGDGELHDDTADDTYDGSVEWFRADPDRRAEQTTMERFQRRNNDLIVPRLLEAGVDLDYVTREGIHEIGPSTFRRHLLPRLAARFAGTPPRLPETFTHRRADEEFTIYGYRVSVRRSRPSFLQLTHARLDGRHVVLTGDGDVEITLPTTMPAATVRVRQPGLPDRTVPGEPGPDGGTRLRVRLDPARHVVGGPGRLQRPGEKDVADLEVVT